MIVYHQEFGRAVAERLRNPEEELLSLEDFLAEPRVPAGTSHVWLISATGALSAFEKFAAFMENADVVWRLAYQDEQYIFVGPTFGRNAGLCYECFKKRLLSHTGYGDRVFQFLARDQFYSRNLRSGHPGFPSTLALTMSAYCREFESRSETNTIIRIPILDEGVTIGEVVPVHGCSRCRPGDVGPARFTSHLKDLFENGALYGN